MPTYQGRFFDSMVILTGAGVSAESGIATFRDAGGLWEGHDPMQLATPEAFARDPELIYRFYNERRTRLTEVQPNPAHRAIARLQQEFDGEVFLVTQNVDDLHERGGSGQVCHMHGELNAMLCARCGESVASPGDFDENTECPGCSTPGHMRPDVVWFGEVLPQEAIDAAMSAARHCDFCFSVGTTSLVHPAASLPLIALESGAPLVEVNPQETPLSPHAEQCFRGSASDVLTALTAQLREALSAGG